MVNIKVISELVEKHKSATAAVAAVEKEIAALFVLLCSVEKQPITLNPPGPKSAFRQNQIFALLVSPQSTQKLVAVTGASEHSVRSALRDLRAKKRIKFDAAIGKYRHA